MAKLETIIEQHTPPIGISGQVKSWWTIVLLTICTLIAYTGMLSINLLVDPIKAELEINDLQFSFLQGIAYVVPVAISGIIFGFFVDRSPPQILLSIGLIIWGAGTIGCGLADSYTEFIFARALLGFGKGALVPVAITIVARIFTPAQRGKALGLYFVGIGMGPGIGIWVAGMIYESTQAAIQGGLSLYGDFAAWRIVFLIIGLPTLALVPLLFTMADKRSETLKNEQGSMIHSNAKHTKKGSNGFLFFCIFSGLILVAFTDTASISWLPSVFTRQFDYGIAEAGAVFAIIAIGGGGMGPLISGWASDRIYQKFGPRGRLMACAIASFILSILYLSFLVHSPYFLITSLVFVAILVTGIGTVGMVIIQEFLPERVRGLGTGITYSLGMLFAGNGASAVAVATDYLYSAERTGHAITTVCAPIALLAGLLLMLATRITLRQDKILLRDRGA